MFASRAIDYDAKNKYGFGMLLVQYLLMDMRPKTKKRPEYTHTINPTIYTFYHKNGNIFTGRQYDFKKQYNIPNSSLCNLISEKYKTTFGWSLNSLIHMTNNENYPYLANDPNKHT